VVALAITKAVGGGDTVIADNADDATDVPPAFTDTIETEYCIPDVSPERDTGLEVMPVIGVRLVPLLSAIYIVYDAAPVAAVYTIDIVLVVGTVEVDTARPVGAGDTVIATSAEEFADVPPAFTDTILIL
jgi:hypothetical protein